MVNKMLEDNSGYVDAILALIITVMITYILIITILPIHDQLSETLIENLNLADNQFYTQTVQDRFDMSNSLLWKTPFIFIGLGFVYCVVRVIKRQQYTRYPENK